MKIFRISHFFDENTDYISNDVFSDFIIGKKSKENSFIGDLDCEDNISNQETHSEMRAHYYVWKNLMSDYDYIGFEHYRRILYLDPFPLKFIMNKYPRLLFLRKLIEKNQQQEIFHDKISFNNALEIRKEKNFHIIEPLKEKVSSYDIICIRSQNISTKSEFCDDTLLEHCIVSCSYFHNKPMLIDFNHTTTNYRCSFIMKKDLFDEYMHFWHEVMKNLQKSLNVYPRELGYYSEKLFSYYVFQKKMENSLIKVTYVPMLSI
ncbi:DUF4422 domain-containing protein [Acetobacter estunensis]|nr:DUF4422 domain-containing protein [Acetobacter estunensis]